MVDAAVQMMADIETFVPTHIADANEETVGPVLFELTCKALATGQALMVVGGYIVRGIVFACKRRAQAIRNQDGICDVVRPEHYTMARIPTP